MNINRVLRLLILALLFGSLAGQAGAGEISPAPPPTRAIPKAILPPVPPIFIGTELADSSLWLTPDGGIVGYDDLIPETYPNPEAKWIKIEIMPFQPDPFKDISNCPWRIKVVPESQAEKLMNEGWEFVDSVVILRYQSALEAVSSNASSLVLIDDVWHYQTIKFILKKRVCEEKP